MFGPMLMRGLVAKQITEIPNANLKSSNAFQNADDAFFIFPTKEIKQVIIIVADGNSPMCDMVRPF